MPVRYRVASSQAETHDTVTLGLEPVDQPIAAHRPGQFTMLYAFGIGEVPISISGTRRARPGPNHPLRRGGDPRAVRGRTWDSWSACAVRTEQTGA